FMGRYSGELLVHGKITVQWKQVRIHLVGERILTLSDFARPGEKDKNIPFVREGSAHRSSYLDRQRAFVRGFLVVSFNMEASSCAMELAGFGEVGLPLFSVQGGAHHDQLQ